jgi:hypothetical protein
MGETPLDPRAVRMLTRHYANLQGLRMIPLLLCYQFGAWTWLATGSSIWRAWAAGLAALAVFLVPILVIERHYQHFGRVVAEQRSKRASAMAIGGGVFLLRAQFHVLPRFPNIVGLALAAYLAWLAWDCRPYRWHLLLMAAAAIYIAFGSVDAPDGLGWIARRFWALMLADIVAGTLDHHVFVRLMRGRTIHVEATR